MCVYNCSIVVMSETHIGKSLLQMIEPLLILIPSVAPWPIFKLKIMHILISIK